MNQQPPTTQPSSGVAVWQSASLTVKQVAARLGVSVSTVYRIKRVNGPFVFVPARRRVLIDAESFEEYLTKKRTQSSATLVAAITEVTAPQPTQEPARTVRKGTGQRELNVTWRGGPSLVVFMW